LEGVRDPTPTYRGKVRDVYARGARNHPARDQLDAHPNDRGDELLLVATDRISAFDVVLGTVPFKGQLLTEQAAFWLEKAAAVCRTHLLERVDPCAMRCLRTEALPIELVVRGYLAGSLLREPPDTRGSAYGLRLDPHLPDYGLLPAPIVTPTTKEPSGAHDRPCSLDEIVASGRVAKPVLDRAVEIALSLFALGSAHARSQGLLLVDTKYELGTKDGEVILIDEVHTADSSRFWIADTYEARRQAGQAPEMLDKERLRRWLLAQGFDGHGSPPALSDDVRVDLASHYWDLTERVTGRPFEPTEGDPTARVEACVRAFLS
jgi:phosphoribosylaminoimidazole-succinocarboxamide synthase